MSVINIGRRLQRHFEDPLKALAAFSKAFKISSKVSSKSSKGLQAFKTPFKGLGGPLKVPKASKGI